ncbi:MAG: endo-1,4-beta-xylanase [Lachnospiraceae bacterium]|nr:endo-1,4-beta-xylanase [Lachnospiraceae bacterium]
MKQRLWIVLVCAMLAAVLMAGCEDKKNNTAAETVTPTQEIVVTPTEEATPTPTEVPATPTPTPNPLDEHTLKEVFDGQFLVGMAMPISVINNPDFKSEIVGNFNSMTFENETKPDALLRREASQNGLPETYTEPVINLEALKRSMKFAADNGIKVRFHTLLWHEQTPDWFFKKNYSTNGEYVDRETMLKRMESYIRQVMQGMEELYPGQIYCYDVVNEAIDPGQGGVNGMRVKSPWYEIVGPDFMEYAFAYARKYAPEGVDLYYNDYNCYQKTSQILACLKPIKDAGNIDGIGMQSHLSITNSVESCIRKPAALFTSEGYKVQLTELDIGITDANGAEDTQARKYRLVFKKMSEGKADGSINIDCITVWGLYDSISWRRDEKPLLYRMVGTKLVRKKAWYGAMQDPEIKAIELQ